MRSTRSNSRVRRAAVFMAAMGFLTGCTHTEVWNLYEYVERDSPKEARIGARLRTLYSTSCRLPHREERADAFIINGERVALLVPDGRARACRSAIPVAICEVPPGRDPGEVCRRLQ